MFESIQFSVFLSEDNQKGHFQNSRVCNEKLSVNVPAIVDVKRMMDKHNNNGMNRGKFCCDMYTGAASHCRANTRTQEIIEGVKPITVNGTDG